MKGKAPLMVGVTFSLTQIVTWFMGLVDLSIHVVFSVKPLFYVVFTLQVVSRCLV